MREIQSPENLLIEPQERSVFLAGSIDMGSAKDWQEDLVKALASSPGVLLNPRRRDWDLTWSTDISFPPFREQVEWELTAMEAAGRIAFYFAPSSKAPITLLELGLAARTRKAIVCCPAGYWRKGNVDVVCRYYDVQTVESIDLLAEAIRSYVGG